MAMDPGYATVMPQQAIRDRYIRLCNDHRHLIASVRLEGGDYPAAVIVKRDGVPDQVYFRYQDDEYMPVNHREVRV